MSQSPDLTEYTSRPSGSNSLDNALFLERLDTFMQKSLNDIQAFAERESMSYEESRRCVAEWHAKALFTVAEGGGTDMGDSMSSMALEEKETRARNILIETSKVLESLADVLGIQSFILAVDPQNPQDSGFLGGSVIGREFYRGIRGGGAAGAGSFKLYAQKRLPIRQEETIAQDAPVHSNPAPLTVRSARQVKVDLYESIRSQLRKVSGIRKAEMKWTNPERLSLYGVRMVGWPLDVPAANPSSLKASQNQKLLELVEHGELKFEKILMTGMELPLPPDPQRHTPEPTTEYFSWAYDAEGGTLGESVGTTTTTKPTLSTSSLPLEPTSDTMLSSPADAVVKEESGSLGTEGIWKENDSFLDAQYNGMPGFDEYGFNVEPWNATIKFEELEGEGPIEPRARKRARSSESS